MHNENFNPLSKIPFLVDGDTFILCVELLSTLKSPSSKSFGSGDPPLYPKGPKRAGRPKGGPHHEVSVSTTTSHPLGDISDPTFSSQCPNESGMSRFIGTIREVYEGVTRTPWGPISTSVRTKEDIELRS